MIKAELAYFMNLPGRVGSEGAGGGGGGGGCSTSSRLYNAAVQDSYFGIGIDTLPLRVGYDCPNYAVYVDAAVVRGPCTDAVLSILHDAYRQFCLRRHHMSCQNFLPLSL